MVGEVGGSYCAAEAGRGAGQTLGLGYLHTYSFIPRLSATTQQGRPMAALSHAQLESALARALAVAQCLARLHASQQVHGSLEAEALHFLPDGSVCLRPPASPTPQQPALASAPDAGCDLYRLGHMLYSWLLDRPAPQDATALAAATPHSLEPCVPLQLSELVMRLLHAVPEARYASADGLADDLQRCLQQQRASGQVARFALGSTELRSQFLIPERLYGRADEMAQLLHLWQRAVSGEVLLCLVSGGAGMGKTALVQALQASVQAADGLLTQACPQQLPQGLGEPEAPLLLFLDDWPWSDASALADIGQMLRQRPGGHVLLVAACREQGIDTAATLMRLLGELGIGQAPLNEIRLGPLPLEEVAALIDDACFHLKSLPALALRVMQQGRGNPRDTRHCLEVLVRQGRLHYLPQAKGWRWSADHAPSRPGHLWCS